ncbi:Uncharacterized protein Fot_04181 [Forsythia ovata]|uniref:Uncharacterized protein n=1 Tax=Forsythia ovata TaxID=205694 RepID=A0ABD1XCB8_9LAMI
MLEHSDNLMDNYPHYALFSDIKDGAGIAINLFPIASEDPTLQNKPTCISNGNIECLQKGVQKYRYTNNNGSKIGLAMLEEITPEEETEWSRSEGRKEARKD